MLRDWQVQLKATLVSSFKRKVLDEIPYRDIFRNRNIFITNLFPMLKTYFGTSVALFSAYSVTIHKKNMQEMWESVHPR